MERRRRNKRPVCLSVSLLLVLSICTMLSSAVAVLGEADSSKKSCGPEITREPGSWPPRCKSKCGKCRPCRPVHVALPPVTAEYYPQAWRCKCGNNLYMP